MTKPRKPKGHVMSNWVESFRAPSGDLPLIVMDFAGGRYWANGTDATFASLVDTDRNVVSGEGLWLDIVAAGDTPQALLINAAQVALFAEQWTSLTEYKTPTGVNDAPAMNFITLADDFLVGNVYHQQGIVNAGSRHAATEWDFEHEPNVVRDVGHVAGVYDATFKFAVTRTPAKLVISVSGQLPVISTTPNENAAFSRAGLANGNGLTPTYLRVLCIYPAQPDNDLALISG